MMHTHRLRGSKGMESILISGLSPIGHYGAPSTLEYRLADNADQPGSIGPKNAFGTSHVVFSTTPSGISPTVA